MEKLKLDNGLLPLSYLMNILAPFGILVYFSFTYFFMNEDNLIIIIALGILTMILAILYLPFRKVELDDEYVYIKNVLNKQTDSFPIRNIKKVERMLFTINTKGSRIRGGKNYKIIYVDNNGINKKVRFMATVESKVVKHFEKATSFLGQDGFIPE
jgi:hypothetical protein